MSQTADIQLTSLEQILEILRNQALAIPTPSTSSRYLRALDSLRSSVASHHLSENVQDKIGLERSPSATKKQVGDLPVMPKPQAEAWGSPANSTVASERRFMVEPDDDNSSFIVHRLSLSITDWLVSLWLTAVPFATASLYLDIISSLYGSAAKAGLLPPTKLFSQLKADLKAIGTEGWKQGIDDEIFDRALRLTKNASRLIADDAIAASLIIHSLTHNLLPLSEIALLKKSPLPPDVKPQRKNTSSAASEASRSRTFPPEESGLDNENFAPLRENDSQKAPRPSSDNNSQFSILNSQLVKRRERYLFPLRQSQRTPKQLQAHIAKIINALFRRARLPQATDPFQTVEALWAYAALRIGIPASTLVSHLGHAPLGLPILKLSVVSCQLSENSQVKIGLERSPSATERQVGDLPVMPKPQASAWGNSDNSTVASERRFMVKSNESLSSGDPESDNSSFIVHRSSFEEIGKVFLENPPRWYAMSLRLGVRFTQICRRIQLLGDRLPDIHLFYPSEEIARAIGKKIVVRERPFIHSVVFFRAKLTDIGRLFSKIGDLAWCYRQNSRPGAPYADISESQFRLFQQTIARFTPDYEVAPIGELKLNEGDRVEILGGLFQGQEATILSTPSPSSPQNKSKSLSSCDPEERSSLIVNRSSLNKDSSLIVNSSSLNKDSSFIVNRSSFNNVVYRLSIIGDNGIEWRLHADSRLLKPN